MSDQDMFLPVGATIGILGGGQLGRMLSVAAARLGYPCHIYDPAPNPPAGHVAAHVVTARWDDADALRDFAAKVDVITFEFENIPASTLDILETVRPVRPGRRALVVSQDRLTEKDFLRDIGCLTAPYAPVATPAEMEDAIEEIGLPAILKTRRMGYDGKGQVLIRQPEETALALASMNGAEAILEGFVSFSHEVSVIAARGLTGEVVAFDPGENLHRDGILRETRVPARLAPSQQADAVLMAGRILNALDHVGVMGVEMFVTAQGLVVNEIAPRVHNSGHWTQNGCAVDQFEQHIRAVAGLPLGDGARHADVMMQNLVGDDLDLVPALMRKADAALHLYGKPERRDGRKMGHVNHILRPGKP